MIAMPRDFLNHSLQEFSTNFLTFEIKKDIWSIFYGCDEISHLILEDFCTRLRIDLSKNEKKKA